MRTLPAGSVGTALSGRRAKVSPNESVQKLVRRAPSPMAAGERRQSMFHLIVVATMLICTTHQLTKTPINCSPAPSANNPNSTATSTANNNSQYPNDQNVNNSSIVDPKRGNADEHQNGNNETGNTHETTNQQQQQPEINGRPLGPDDQRDLVTYLFNEFYHKNVNTSLFYSDNLYGDPQSSASLKRELQLYGSGLTAEESAAIAASPSASGFATYSGSHLHPVGGVLGSGNELAPNGSLGATYPADAGMVRAASNGSVVPLRTVRPFFGDIFYQFQSLYWPIHCILCLVICSLGIFANVTNIIVLTRPNMITAVNTILSAIALSDLIVNIFHIPFLMHEMSDSNVSTFPWAVYILFHAHTTVTAHTISIWLTCVLATWRYLVVCRSQSSNHRNWSVALAKRTIVAVFLLVPVFCIPNYLSFALIEEEDASKNSTIYKVGLSQLASESDLLQTFHFSVFSCLTKLVPCVLLTFFTTALIRKLFGARKRRLRLACFNESDKGKLSVPNGNQQIVGGILVKRAANCSDSNARSDLVFSEAQDGGRNHRFSASFATCDMTKSAQELGNRTAPELCTGADQPTQREKVQSGSSCATDAEIIASSGSSSNASSASNETSQQQTRILSQLIVESDGANATTVSTSTARVLAACDMDAQQQQQQQSGAPNLIIANDIVTDDAQRQCSPLRSASTCGALELYSARTTRCNSATGDVDNANFGTGSQPLVSSSPEQDASDAIGARSSIGTVFYSKRTRSMAGTNAGKRTSEASCKSPRSKPIATPAPFQMVKIQAAQRQLNQNETTTRLLIAVMIVFLVCEFPAGILAALCAILGKDFVENVYKPVALLTDLLALINSSVNFILYCFMSTQFRITFYRVVLHCPAPAG